MQLDNEEILKEEIKRQIDDLCISLDSIPLEGLKQGTFEWALSQLKSGNSVRRESWKGIYSISITELSSLDFEYDRFLSIKNTNSNVLKVFSPTFEEIFAEDWEL